MTKFRKPLLVAVIGEKGMRRRRHYDVFELLQGLQDIFKRPTVTRQVVDNDYLMELLSP